MEKRQFNNDLVSVIVPCYNAAGFIKDTVDSILAQSYDDVEIVIIDDKSTDNSREVISEYAEKYSSIKPVFLEKNGGVSNARNVGIEKASGRYIAFLDSDDMWTEDKLEKQIDFMKKNDYGFTYTAYTFINDVGESLESVVMPKSEVDYEELLKHNVIPCLTVVIDRNKIDEIVMPKIRHEDYACWLSILKRGHKAYGLSESLAFYRTRSNSLSGNKLKAATWTWNILRHEEKLPLYKACYYFAIYALVNVNKHFIKK